MGNELAEPELAVGSQDEVWVFTAYRYGKNAGLIVGETDDAQSD